MRNLKPAIVAAALAALAVPAAFASSGTTLVNNEAGVRSHAMPASGKTRAQVLDELEAFKKNPISADGGRYVGGEAGWVYVDHKFDLRGGRLVHADSIDHHAPRPNPTMTPQERDQYRQLYTGG